MDKHHRNLVRERFVKIGRKHNWFNKPNLSEKIAEVSFQTLQRKLFLDKLTGDVDKILPNDLIACLCCLSFYVKRIN